MKQKQHFVSIKGTKDGFKLILDDRCSYDILMEELDEKLSASTRNETEGRLIPVQLDVGNRYLTLDEEQEIRDLIRRKKNLVVERIDCNVITKEEAEEMRRSNQVVSIAKIIRSGQVLEVHGDLLLIGDINPGGKVIASGNIYVMGVIRGIAHAGANGDRAAVIAASVMKPSQLRIASIVSRAPDHSSQREKGNEMECAYIEKEDQHITIDRVQILPNLRPNLSRA
jgi:septum site-determining protein MinC